MWWSLLNAYLREDLICNAECVWVTIPLSNYTYRHTVHVACAYLLQVNGYEEAVSSLFAYLLK